VGVTSNVLCLVKKNMRCLVLVTDAFGGTGGIAQFNKSLLKSLSSYPRMKSITCLPRVISREIEDMPSMVDYKVKAANNNLRYIKEMLNLLSKSNHFDFILCGHINLLPIATLFHKIHNSPIHLILHGYEAWTKPNYLRHKCVKYVNQYWPVSKFTWERFITWSKASPKKFNSMSNSIDLTRFKKPTNETSISHKYALHGKRILMTVGRMSASEKYKGFDQVLTALPNIIRKNDKIIYLVVGDGDDFERLRQKSIDLGISKHVVFTGYVSEQEKLDLYRCAEIYVMPSQAEGFGIVYLEALASGLTVIGGSVDASPEVLQNGAWGYLVNPHDISSISSTILKAFDESIHVSHNELELYSFDQFNIRCHTILNNIDT
jgi:phosphatidylinositol alpha-1,6-mannosyltransferase